MAPKRRFLMFFFFNFLGINTHNLVKNDSKFENKNLFHAKLYVDMMNFYVDMIRFLDAKAVKLGVWSLKPSLGNLGPKDVSSHKSGTLAPIFARRTTSFSPQS